MEFATKSAPFQPPLNTSVATFPAPPSGRTILLGHGPGMLSPANFQHSFGVMEVVPAGRGSHRAQVKGPTQRVLYFFIKASLGNAGRSCFP
jgi:hypothetical protein